MDNLMRMEFLNKSINEGFARCVAASFAGILDPTVNQLSDIKTAVSEAVTNAIIHGYEDCEGMVVLEGRIEGDTIEFTVSDTGKGIADINIAMQPLYTGKPDSERSGMGFTIMESFMDSISVESKLGEG
ncbi:MAG: anti-sigma F factor, partial [Oscillospiraceae bacterium]|nr:anti-sigma F factor [Oscillospiraceae bacterium]